MRKLIFIVSFSILLFSCERWRISPIENQDTPHISSSIINVNGTSVVCEGTVIDNGGVSLISRGFCLSLNPTPTFSDSINIQLTGSDNFDITINNLIPDTSYYICAYAKNIMGIAISNICKFRTSKIPLIPFNPYLNYGYVKDIDGNTYKTIKIGNQTWMAENLRVTHYRNGDSIPLVNDYNNWINLKLGSQCPYDYSTSFDTIAKYGRYYNWFAMMDNRNLAPRGWHIPTIQEWGDLENYLSTNGYKSSNNSSSKDIAKSLATTSGWYPEETHICVGFQQYKNNKSGFSALPAPGMMALENKDAYYYIYANWWCYCPDTTKVAGFNNIYIGFNYYDAMLLKKGGIGSIISSIGLSIRCIKDN
jgi:uncharacterized protein (TIGR02145 family)